MSSGTEEFNDEEDENGGFDEEEDDKSEGTDEVDGVPDETKFTETTCTHRDDLQEEKLEERPIVEAKQIYILMAKEYRISRNRRAEWFFNVVNNYVSYPSQRDGEGRNIKDDKNRSSDFEVVSIIPKKEPASWSVDSAHKYRYHVSPDTKIVYLSRRYRIVFCLDISPSVASVDVQAGGVVFDNIFKALQASLHGLLQPFKIPGTKRTFCPEIFLTVVAHTPFFAPVTDQVLIQGQILDKDTCSNILLQIFDRLNDTENRIANLITKRVQELSPDPRENGFLKGYIDGDGSDEDETDGNVFEESPTSAWGGSMVPPTSENEPVTNNKTPRRTNANKWSSFLMSPDFGLLDLLRQALIALSLMPENSSPGLVILTDGVISVPDGRYLDIILNQLRYNTVSCSFIQLSSPFHPHLCHGVLPYADLMKFIASATFGAYLSEAPEIAETGDGGMNAYHNAFLAWSFHKTLETEWTKQRPPAKVKPGEWSVRNKCFFSVRDMPIVKKQQYEHNLDVDHMKVMSCRLREGFTIKEVITSPETGLAEVTLILPWKFLINLEYKIYINSYLYENRNLTDLAEPTFSSKVRCVVSLEGPYDFLHDVTCLAKKPFSSLYRQLMVNRFWATRKNLSESDRLLVHLNSFSANQAYYNIPESLKNGMPLFYWGGANSSALPQLQTNEQSYPQFTSFWKPVCLLDTTVWQKWMHTHRIGVILEHDYPLPKNLHLPNSTGRFNVVQCRQAIMALNISLKNMSSFVLLENQSYVYLMYKSPEDKVPHSFCLVRVTSKPPHVVLRLAFLVGTPGHLRHETVAQFRAKIASLTFPQRVKDPPKWRVIMNTPVAKAAATASPLVNKTSWSDMPCCVIVHKPVEKIMIRYDKSPDDFRERLLSVEDTSLYIPEGKSAKQSTFGFRPTYQTAPVAGNAASCQMLPEVFNTIARYLHHRRWIWWFPGGDLRPLNAKWASEILATVTKMRLQEGFRFAFSSAGITNMVLELPMKNRGTNKNTVAPMVLQFIVFPPTSDLKSEDFDLDSVDTGDSLYLVTECWIEPQCGFVTEDEAGSDIEDIPVVAKQFLGLPYTDIPRFLYKTDRKCISLVGTFEYLVRICSNKEIPFLVTVNQPGSDVTDIDDESIKLIPFEFDLKHILKRSGQIEILFSSFLQDLSLTFPTEWNLSVCSFFERANALLYQHWCSNMSVFQDKEVALTKDQHEVATRAILKRKGFDDMLDDDVTASKTQRNTREKNIQWRCFVRSSSSTHVLVTLVPATLKDLKHLLLQLDLNVETLHKTRSSRYVDFIGDMDYNTIADATMECPNQLGSHNVPVVSSASSSSSPQLLDHHQLNCKNCQSAATSSVASSIVNRKRVRAFSGGSECAPAIKKYLSTPVPIAGTSQAGDEVFATCEDTNEQEEATHPVEACSGSDGKAEDEQKSAYVRSQTFSEGTVSGKLAHFMRAKRTLSDQSGGAANGAAVGSSGEQDQDNICFDRHRCNQLYDYLNRCGGTGASGTGSAMDDALRYVPCRPPVVGSLAYCVFTYSCSLMSLTDHVVFNKVSSDQLTKDFRVFRDPLSGYVGGYGEFDQDTGDDDDELSSESGSMFPNGRSISQESFSESSLQRLEAAEQEALVKVHCTQMREGHLRAYIVSAYRSLLSGYYVNPCDIKVVIDRCTLTRVRFPLNKFLHHVCHHEKSILQVLADFNEEVLCGEERRRSTHEADDKAETEASMSSSSSNEKKPDCCRQLEAIHSFIKKRFRRLLSRNFSPVSDDGNEFYYKIAGSNAFSDVSGFCGASGATGNVKCSSDIEDNIDSCSIVADSLCSADDHYPISSLHITSDIEPNPDRSPGNNTTDRRSMTNITHQADHGVANDTDNHSFSGCTQGSVLGQSSVLVQCAPLFGYLTCAFRIIDDEGVADHKNDKDGPVVDLEEDDTGYLRLSDVPTCYHQLCLDYIRKVADEEDPEDVLDLTPNSKFQLTMELTFFTAPDSEQEQTAQKKSLDDSGSSGTSQSGGRRSFRQPLAEFQKRLSLRQANAIDHLIRDINWLMEDEITSFRGGGGGPGSGAFISSVDEPLLETISNHVMHSLDKMGCIHQQIRLSFVEHTDNKGFNSFLDRFNNLAVNEYSFKQVGMWWYLVRTPETCSEELDGGDQPELNTSAGSSSTSNAVLPAFWIILRAFPPTVLDLYHHCRYDENDLATLQFSRNLRVRIIDLISNLIRTINQDLLLQQLHDTRVCSPFLEMEDPPDLEEATDMMIIPRALTSISKFADSESDISSTLPLGMFVPGMFSCQVVWVTTFTLHSRLRSGGGKTAFARGIQQLRSALTAFEVAERKNMFVYRDAMGNVFYMRFYRGVDVLEGSATGSPSKTTMESTYALAEDVQDAELQSVTSETSSINRYMIKRTRNQDSESEKGRDDPCDGTLALKVHGIVPAGEEIKEKLVQSLRNKLDDAVLEILCVTLKRNPHCKLTPDDVHFLQQPRSKPDCVFNFKLTRFIIAGHLPAFSFYLHQNLLQFLSIPKYTSIKTKYHFQDYSRLQDLEAAEGCTGGGGDSSMYLYNQSPGGGGTGNKGIAVVSMALTDRYGGLVRNPEWKQPDFGAPFDITKFERLLETCIVVGKEKGEEEGIPDEDNVTVMVEFNMWKQGRINVDLLKSHLELAIKQAGWDLIMEFKVLTAPLAVLNQILVEEESVFLDDIEESVTGGVERIPESLPHGPPRRRSSHLNSGTKRSNSTSGQNDDDDEPRVRSLSFTGLHKNGEETGEGKNKQIERERPPSPVPLHLQARGINEGSRPRILLSRSQSAQLSLSPAEVDEVGSLHKNYSDFLDSWMETGKTLGAPSLRTIIVPLNCRYPVPCIVQEVEKIINQVAPDITPRQFWKPSDSDEFVSYVGGQPGSLLGTCAGTAAGIGSTAGVSLAGTIIGGRRDSGGGGCGSVNWGTDEYSLYTSEYNLFKRHEQELWSLEDTEEAEYPTKILNLFRKNENFQPGGKGNTCFLIARNLAHWKSCLRGDSEFALHSTQDFKNLYKFPPLLNDNFDVDGSRGSIEKLSRSNFSRGDFFLWSSGKTSGTSSSAPIMIPRQRFLRVKVTSTEVDFVVYNWSKECCERLQEQVTYLTQWIQARACLLSSLLLQKSGIFYCQPILPDNFACSDEGTNPFIMGDVDLKDLILNTAPIGKMDRRSHHFHHPAPVGGGMAGGGPGAMSRLMSKLGMTVPGGPNPGSTPSSTLLSSTIGSPSNVIVSGGIPSSAISKPAQAWADFYRNMSLCNLLSMPDPVGENPVDAHGRQLLHVMNAHVHTKDPENTIFQYWLTRGPSASNVITTQMLESFTKTARTIHFCLTPVMFLPTWRAAIAQTRDSSSAGGLIRRNRVSTRRYTQLTQTGPSNNKLSLPPSVLHNQRIRHGSEASQASSLASLRNRSKSYHSGMMNLFLPPEVISEKDFESTGSVLSMGPSPQQIQQEKLFLKVKTDEPWHGVVCKIFLQEYMQYLQTLGFVPVHCKASGTCTPSSPGAVPTGGPKTPEIGPKSKRVGPPTRSNIRDSPSKVKVGSSAKTPINTGLGSNPASTVQQDVDGIGDDDERMIHFLQRCLPGGIMVIEVGLVPPFFYCKIHALEAKRIFPSKPNKTQNKATTVKTAVQFVDECEKMKVLTHLHSFMYDFHLRAMFLYISGRQQLFKVGYHITTFLDDFITYYPKCPNFSRNAVHIGMITLEEVTTPTQLLFNYILGHDKYYRMKVIRMAPFNPVTGCSEESSSEYVLVHSLSRKVSYRSVSERPGGELEPEQPQQSQDEFDLTLVIAHDFPSSNRECLPNSQGLRVKYYIVLTSRRELYPKGDSNNEFNAGKLCPVSTPSLLCSRSGGSSCVVGSPGSSLGIGGIGSYSKLAPPPAPPSSFFEGFEGTQNAYSQYSLQHHSSMIHHQITPKVRQLTGQVPSYSSSQQAQQGPDMIREEKVRYMGYFSSHEQLMQKIIDEQKDTMEQFIRQLITKAAVDCRRDLLWQRLLTQSPAQMDTKPGKRSIAQPGKSTFSPASSMSSPLLSSFKEDAITRETMGPLSYQDFNELLSLVQIIPLNKMDTRLEDLLCQPVSFYQTLIKVLTASSFPSLGLGQSTPAFNIREFTSHDHLIHQLAIYMPDAHKSILMVEVNMEQVKCDIYVIIKDGKKVASQQKQPEVIPPFSELGEGMYTLVEKVVNACCYTTWSTLI